MGTMKLPLEGIRVVELATHVAVPMVGRLLADWGAEVIKVENPSGDEWRILGRNYGVPINEDDNPVFTMPNAGKELVALNLKSAEGKEVLLKLLDEADIFICSVRMKSMQKMGLDYDTLKKRVPKLIYAHFSGFGPEGPDAERPGLDRAAYWAKSGAMIDFSSIGDHPINPLSGFGDATTSTMLLSGILAALLARGKTGEGTFLNTSLYGSALWYAGIGVVLCQEQFGGQFPKDADNPPRPLAHFYQCQDDEWIIMVSVDHDKNFPLVAKAMGLDDYLNDPRFNSSKTMDAEGHGRELTAILQQRFRTKPSTEWAEIFAANDLVYEPVYHVKDTVKDPQALANHYISNVTMPNGLEVSMSTNPVQFSAYGRKAEVQHAGGIGCDTDAVLARLGYTPQQIAQMKADKAVK
ncbi:MAG: CoA transferase [Ruminococcaceae bacterium]|nr:CoA transferase [Oscillospiraceae bacterium]